MALSLDPAGRRRPLHPDAAQPAGARSWFPADGVLIVDLERRVPAVCRQPRHECGARPTGRAVGERLDRPPLSGIELERTGRAGRTAAAGARHRRLRRRLARILRDPPRPAAGGPGRSPNGDTRDSAVRRHRQRAITRGATSPARSPVGRAPGDSGNDPRGELEIVGVARNTRRLRLCGTTPSPVVYVAVRATARAGPDHDRGARGRSRPMHSPRNLRTIRAAVAEHASRGPARSRCSPSTPRSRRSG